MIEAPRPKVSVSILTYNQEDLIAQAIDSVLMQEIDFAIEIHIGDDFSTDGTRAILEDYRRRHPDRIFLNLQPERPNGIVGRLNNMTNLSSCRGQYIAMLDGDDYWTDPTKLQRQVNILDADPALGGVAHDARIVNDRDGTDTQQRFSQQVAPVHPVRDIVTLDDVLLLPPFQTSTFVFVAEAIRPFPEWFYTVPAGDWGIFALVANRGPICVLRETLSVYRRHSSSVTAELMRNDRLDRVRWQHMSMLMIADAFPRTRRRRLWHLISLRLHILHAYNEGNWRSAIRYLSLFGLVGPDRIARALINKLRSTSRQ